jgi:adenylate cyclase
MRKQERRSAMRGARMPDQKASVIRNQLNRMLSSGAFKATPAQKDLLRFVVEKAIAGHARNINGYTIATQVFKRNSDFDQATDPIVSVQAGRLRKALKGYYLGDGRNDPIRVEIPTGTFVPSFHEQDRVKPESKTGSGGDPTDHLSARWPSVLIRPFENLTGETQLNYITIGFVTELAMELSRYQDLRVLRQPPGEPGKVFSERMTRYLIEGDLRKDGKGGKVSVQLIDRATGVQLWARSDYSCFDAMDVMKFQEETARIAAAHVAGEHGVIALNLSRETRSKPPSELKAYDAILRYYEFDLELSPESYLTALTSLENAVKIDEDCDQVCSMLGRLYALNYSHEFFPQTDSLKDAVRLAEKGVTLNPENQRARAILAFCLILSNEIAAAEAELRRSLALNPKSLFFSDTIGYLMMLCGIYDEGVELVQWTMRQNPYHSPQAHDALCYDWFRQGEYERAYQATLNFRRPSNFWEPLIRGALLGLLGRIDEGKVAVEQLLSLKPSFPDRGMTLMKHYLKFDEILDPFVSGLRKVGLEIS